MCNCENIDASDVQLGIFQLQIMCNSQRQHELQGNPIVQESIEILVMT
jgi:hypothetical protein